MRCNGITELKISVYSTFTVSGANALRTKLRQSAKPRSPSYSTSSRRMISAPGERAYRLTRMAAIWIGWRLATLGRWPTGASLRSLTGPTSNLPLRRPHRLGETNGGFQCVGCCGEWQPRKSSTGSKDLSMTTRRCFAQTKCGFSWPTGRKMGRPGSTQNQKLPQFRGLEPQNPIPRP